MRRWIVAALLALAGCGPSHDTPAAPGLLDVAQYVAQSVRPDGNPATPLHAADPLTYRRHDFAGYQVEDSFLVADGAITDWAYPPYGPFVAANGDGGEHIVIRDGRALIDATQDGSKPGVQHFPTPWTIVAPAKPCAEGWTTINFLERGCAATITYPGSPASITADTIVTEHGDSHAVERLFYAKGWGRLGWQAFVAGGKPVDPARCPDFGWQTHEGMVLADCRIVTNIVPAVSGLAGAQLWAP